MNKKSAEEKTKVTISTKKIILFLVLIIVLTALKVIFLVPAVNQPPAGQTCAGLSAKDAYVTLPQYINSNRSRGCDVYEVKTNRYIYENLATFIVLTIIIFTANYFYDKNKLQEQAIRRQNQSHRSASRRR